MEVFRGMMLQPEQVADMRLNGIRAGSYRRPQKQPWQQPEFSALDLLDRNRNGTPHPWGGPRSGPRAAGHITGIQDAIRIHISDITQLSPFTSVSKFPEVAEMAAWSKPNKYGQKPNPGGDFYLFKLRVPKLDVIRFEGLFKDPIEGWRYQGNPLYVSKKADGEDFRVEMTNPDTEMLINFIGPSEIIDVTHYSALPAAWHLEPQVRQ
jgi:hypothetical protein